MANEAMAQAVLDHAHDFYDTGDGYVVAERWDRGAVLEELKRQEDRTRVAFDLEIAATAHFAEIVGGKEAPH